MHLAVEGREDAVGPGTVPRGLHVRPTSQGLQHTWHLQWVHDAANMSLKGAPVWIGPPLPRCQGAHRQCHGIVRQRIRWRRSTASAAPQRVAGDGGVAADGALGGPPAKARRPSPGRGGAGPRAQGARSHESQPCSYRRRCPSRPAAGAGAGAALRGEGRCGGGVRGPPPSRLPEGWNRLGQIEGAALQNGHGFLQLAEQLRAPIFLWRNVQCHGKSQQTAEEVVRLFPSKPPTFKV
mmetsp:Transcript_5510/g.20813  ORF Transcript_5510/g.20813 Transcript_5510/m.20813 type:complete len:237 (-) Transcript_5510:91-801(-)